MPTPQEIRNIRLKYDYKEMCNIRGAIISWRALRGAPPCVEAYQLTVNIRSIIGDGPNYRDQHVINVEIPANYPNTPPLVVMVSDPGIFHPNWWPADKRWCYGTWNISEGLGYYIIRMLRTLQFDPIISNENSPANSAAKNWYVRHLHGGFFPCDTQTLPDPSKDRFPSEAVIKKRFEVR
jgi:ubiquitin-protein ligase